MTSPADRRGACLLPASANLEMAADLFDRQLGFLDGLGGLPIREQPTPAYLQGWVDGARRLDAGSVRFFDEN